jgi:hypothetical protein
VRGERCDNLAANGVVLEADVWARVDAFLSDPSLVAAEVERQQGDSGLAGGLASDLARIDQALQRFAGQEQRLIKLFRFGEVDEAMITCELTGLRQDREKLQSERQDLVSRRVRAEQTVRRMDSLAAFCERVRDRLKSFDYAGKPRVARRS